MTTDHLVDTESDANWTAIVAIASNGVIGRGEDLPWRLSTDLQRFKKLTMGHCLLMGRKTYESIGRPLPGRQTIVLSRTGFDANSESVTVLPGTDQVNASVDAGRLVMVVGGAHVYQETLERCNRILLTRVLAEVEGDVFFPEVDWQEWELVSSDAFPAGDRDEWPTEFQTWQRKNRH